MIIPEPGIQSRLLYSVLVPEELQLEQEREEVRIQIKPCEDEMAACEKALQGCDINSKGLISQWYSI